MKRDSHILFVSNSPAEVCAGGMPSVGALGVRLIGDPGAVVSLDAWEMTPTNPY